MALTNKGLKEILSEAGVSAENMGAAVTKIMEGHNTTVSALKEERDAAIQERDALKTDAEKLPGIQRELDTLRAAKWEDKYTAEHAALESLKAETAAKEARAAKEKAVRGYLAEKKIDQKAMDAALLAASAASDSFGKLELTRDGKIKDTTILDALVSGTGALASFVTTETVVGAESPPSATVKTTPTFRTLAEAMQYQNEHPETPVNLDQFFQPPPVIPAANGYANAGGTAVPYAGFPVTPTP